MLKAKKYEPEWGDEMFGYAMWYLSHNKWQVRLYQLYELDDLLQESYLLFLKLQQRYEFQNARHFREMWKICLHNWLCTLCVKCTKRRRREVSLGDFDLPDAKLIRAEDAEEWEKRKANAPEPVRRLVEAVERGGGVPSLKFRRYHSGGREATNRHLCRIAGNNPQVPLRAILDRWLEATV